MKQLNEFKLLVFAVLFSAKILSQNPVDDKSAAGKQQLQLTCFIEQSFEPLDSAIVKILHGDSLLEAKTSDKKGSTLFFLVAGEYKVKIARRGYKEKIFENVVVTPGASFIRALMKRDL